ncbi:phosphatase PAP2 family protein [bacterium]|nr:MAG: phosphatase PAP2 family protein [bacterium]
MNKRIFFKLNNLAGKSKILDLTLIFWAKYFAFVFWFWLIIVFLSPNMGKSFNLNREQIIYIHLIGILVWLLVFLIKIIHFTPRPYLIEQTKVLIKKKESSSAFPSGHTALFFALGGTFIHFSAPLGILVFICAFLVGLSRLISGLHWPIDILGGAIIGTFVGFFMTYLI